MFKLAEIVAQLDNSCTEP